MGSRQPTSPVLCPRETCQDPEVGVRPWREPSGCGLAGSFAQDAGEHVARAAGH